MLFSEAASVARSAGAGALLLTHFSTSMDDPETFIPAAREIFPATYAGRDGLEVTLRYPKDQEAAWTSLS